MTSNKSNLGYYMSEEWRNAVRTVSTALGFRVVRIPTEEDGEPDRYQQQVVTWDDKDKETVASVSPADHWAYDAFMEAVRYRIDHDGAAKLAWDLYGAATGVTIESFNGVPEGGPLEAVKAERARLLAAAQPGRPFDIVFDGPSANQSGRFVEVEDASTGASISVGEWIAPDPDAGGPSGTMWRLRISEMPS